VVAAAMIKDQITQDLSLMVAARMSEEGARQVLMACRWPETGGRPVCPKCGYDELYTISGRRTFRCKRCRADVSVTSGTIFAGSKISAKDLLLAACVFVGGAKGVSSLQLSRYLGRQYKSSFVLAHKMREAMQRPELGLGGTVQVDGCTIGGHRIADNTINMSGKRRYRKNLKNRRVVVVARESFGNTKAFVGEKESDALPMIAKTLTSGCVVHADGSNAWNGLSNPCAVARVHHCDAYSQDGVHTNWAESYFAMLRKMHYGTHHQISARHLEAFANELAWRQDNRQITESDKVRRLLTRCLNTPPSESWRGYWQRKGRRSSEKNAHTAET
jgi:transposase-like protein